MAFLTYFRSSKCSSRASIAELKLMYRSYIATCIPKKWWRQHLTNDVIVTEPNFTENVA